MPSLHLRAAAVVVAVALSGFSAALSAVPLPKPGPHYKAICVVDVRGPVHCVRIGDLNRVLSPEQVARFQQLLDDLFPQAAGKTARNAVVGCGHGDWITANVTIPAPEPPFSRGALGSGKRAPGFPSVSDAQGLASRCRASVQGSLDAAIRGAGGDRGQLITATVAQMDAAVAACRDSSSPVAFGTSASRYTDARSRYQEAVAAIEAKYSPSDVINGDHDAMWAYYVLGESKTLAKQLDEFFTRSLDNQDREDRTQTQNFITEVLTAISEGLEALTRGDKPKPAPPPKPPATGPVPVPAVTQPPSDIATPCFGENCKPSCSEIEARWQRFKASCEESGWNAFNCQAFLAAANHCVDPRLINPGPDGDMTCPARAKLDKWGKAKVAWVEQCRRRKWIMTPGERGDYLCVAPSLGVPPPRFDPCNDPRVLTSPDQCGGPAPGNDPRPPRPVPQPDPHRPG